ncbi:MAG: ABC transporter ATP-binding protein [Gemmatimonadales bacterium]|nr:MAG: ABC transporter ATP-binding protein [Gemmatimonadales bacterium]
MSHRDHQPVRLLQGPATKAPAAITASAVGFVFPDGSNALSNVSFSLARGACVGILGPNGSGKTTLLHLLAGVRHPTSGSICIDEDPSMQLGQRGLSPAQRLGWRRKVGLVLDSPEAMLFGGTVEADVAFGPANLGIDPDGVKARVKRELDRLHLQDLRSHPIHALSRGEKRRVAMAGVLAMDPEILLLDEPLLGLDSPSRRDFIGLLGDLRERGKTIVLTSHDVQFVAEEVSHALLIRDGEVLGQGPPEGVLTDRTMLAAAGLQEPWVTEVSRGLGEEGLLLRGDDPLPVRRHEFIALLRSQLSRKRDLQQ